VIPLRDTLRSRRRPVVVYALIAANLAVFFSTYLSLPEPELHRVYLRHGIVPALYSSSDLLAAQGLLAVVTPFVSSMFLHGGILHIVGNMWILWIFGDNVEDWFGRAGFLAFYLFCGVASGLMHVVTNWTSPLPTVGASGAVAGVMGAYFLLYPKARVLTLVPIFVFIHFVELPAFVFLGFWFLIQFLSGTAAAAGPGGGIAWWAHVGGFVAGAAVVFVIGGGRPSAPARSRPTLRSPWDR
jgi:membrane associated rhomboid family serine protease